jgi:hypothetical protein
MSRIPNNIHVVYGLSPDFGWSRATGYPDDADPFNLFRYLTIKSAYEVNKPDNIFFYYQYEPYGDLWDAVQEYITPVRIEAPTEIFGNPIKKYALKTDVIRLQILIEEGGIYLDSDVLCVKPLTPFLNLPGSEGGCVIGREGMFDHKLTNAILLAEKDSEFCKIWLSGFQDFDGVWGKHGVMLPYHLSKQYPELVTVADHKKFTWPLYHTAAMKWFYRGEGWTPNADQGNMICDIGGPLLSNDSLEDSYCIHLWANHNIIREFYKDWPDSYQSAGTWPNDWMTVDRIRQIDTPFNILARPFVKDL